LPHAIGLRHSSLQPLASSFQNLIGTLAIRNASNPCGFNKNPNSNRHTFKRPNRKFFRPPNEIDPQAAAGVIIPSHAGLPRSAASGKSGAGKGTL